MTIMTKQKHIQALLRASSHICPCIKQLYHHSKCSIQSTNIHERNVAAVILERNRTNKEALGINGSISKVRSQAPPSFKFQKIRRQLHDCKAIKDVETIIKSRNDFDLSVYTAAIKKVARLHNVPYCIKLFRIAVEEKQLIPNVFIFSTLFNAFNLNVCPASLSNKFLTEMVNVHNIAPNKVIVCNLIAGCSKTGDIERAQKIWNMMLKCNIQPDEIAYLNMIVTCGQAGFWKEAKRYYDELKCSELEDNDASRGAMLNAFIKNNQIKEALHMKELIEQEGQILSLAAYVPLISYYLRDADHQNPSEALRLLNECVAKREMTQLNQVLFSIKHVALFKMLQKEKDEEERSKLFEIIKNAPNERVLIGLAEWDYNTASVVHGAHLAYFKNDFQRKEVIECFEQLCEMNMIGYWFFDKVLNRWMIDLHGYSYEQLDFVLYYLLNIKSKQLIASMGYTWIFICGKRASVAADAKETQTGAKRYIVDKLWNEFQIKSSSVKENKGRIILNRMHIKRHLASRQENKDCV